MSARYVMTRGRINGKIRKKEQKKERYLMLLNKKSLLIESAGSAICAALPMDMSPRGTGRGPAQPPLHPADFSIFDENDTLDLFLLVGQSNMKGRGSINMKPKENKNILFFHSRKLAWYVARDPLHAQGTPDLIDADDNAGTGPGMSFAQTLLSGDKTLKIGLIPAAVGGAPINLYGKGKNLYKRSLKLTVNAIESSRRKTNIKAMLWLQGESDSTVRLHKTYEKKLLDMIDRYRTDLKTPELPFIACTIGPFITSPKFDHAREVNEILLSLPVKRKHTACIDACDLKGHIGDRLHYDSESQVEIGKRFAAAYLKLDSGVP